MPPSSMKPTPVSVRTCRGTSDRIPTLQETLSFGQPNLDKKNESKQYPSTEKVGPSKSSQRNTRKPLPENDDDNELVKYMSNLPCFLQQQMEKESNIQDKALNFGVLDWKRLEKWKYTECMPPSQKKQSSSYVCNPSSGNINGPNSLRFGSPQRRQNGDEYYKEDKYAKLLKSTKGKPAHNQGYRAAENVGTVRLQDHCHQSVKRKDPKKETLLETEASCNPIDPENTLHLKPKHLQKSSLDSSQFTESRTLLDEQLAEMTGQRLPDFLSPQELKSGELSSDNKRVEIGNHPTTPKDRPPSPMRRLSFDLGKLSRSLSFKDTLAIPQFSPGYTSVKSGPVRLEISSCVDKLKMTDRTNASGRARSSPLRRLLDPLLKHKGAHTGETASSTHTKGPEAAFSPGSKGPTTAFSAGTKDPETAFSSGTKGPRTSSSAGTKGSSHDRKPDGLTLQALLQLSLKNGLPFLKLVVNNSDDMLAASVKCLPVSGKIDPCMVYAFYTVHEIRKKSMGWINQGSKGKSCGLGYNIVGQMKISSSSECESRECVLYGVDPGQLDKQTLDYIPSKEIAAIIVPNRKREFSHCVSEENRNSSGTVVILPGGLHGVPNKGEPSSLVCRWRYGGSCDCGGWDVGCKLRVLVDAKKGSNSLQESMPSSTNDHVILHLEGGEKASSPVFSLKPFSNGYYSIEFDASISLLEAFATCVAYITCSKFPEITEAKSLSGEEQLLEATLTGTDSSKRKTPTTFQEQLPAYVTCPPLSPVGRI